MTSEDACHPPSVPWVMVKRGHLYFFLFTWYDRDLNTRSSRMTLAKMIPKLKKRFPSESFHVSYLIRIYGEGSLPNSAPGEDRECVWIKDLILRALIPPLSCELVSLGTEFPWWSQDWSYFPRRFSPSLPLPISLYSSPYPFSNSQVLFIRSGALWRLTNQRSPHRPAIAFITV